MWQEFIQSPWNTHLLAATMSALASLARQRLFVKKHRRSYLGVGVYTAFLGLGVSMVSYEWFRDSPSVLVGGCILAALAGATSASDMLAWLVIVVRIFDAAKGRGLPPTNRPEDLTHRKDKDDDHASYI